MNKMRTRDVVLTVAIAADFIVHAVGTARGGRENQMR